MSADGLGEVGMWEGRWYNLMMDGRVYLAGIQGWVVYDILGKGLGMLIMAEGRGMIRRRGKGGGWGLEEGWFMYFYGFGGLAYSCVEEVVCVWVEGVVSVVVVFLGGHNLELESIVQFSASTSHRHPALEGAKLLRHCFRQIQDPSLCVNKEFFLFVTS
ncbi:hypothetical protein Tco_0886580 [Tanacetum coccineum]